MSLSETPKQQIIREMDEARCPVCRNDKVRGQSFCKVCYFKLEVQMRQALYKQFGHGYEEAYTEAKEYLIGELRAKGKR